MDFANERYVRLYVRETTTWKLLPWESQALAPQILRLVDRAGVLDLGGVSPAEAIAAQLPKWPLSVIEVGLPPLMQRRVIEHNGDTLVWPRFLEAQEALQSDRQRQAEARAKRRDLARVVVTDCDEQSHAVTDGHENGQNRHAVSHGVTPSVPSVPCRAVSPLRPPKLPKRVRGHVEYPPEFERVWDKYPKRAGGNPKRPAFESWRARLADGVSAEELESAADRYGAYCQATGKIGTEYVLQLAAFFGPKREGWKEAWTPPVEAPPNGKSSGPRKLQLVTGKVIEVKPGIRLEYTDDPEAIDGFALSNGRLSVRSGARWVK